MAAVKKGGLGKGLDALFIDNSLENKDSSVLLRLTEIEPNKEQPRKQFDESALSELADSIKEHGVLQPLIVRPLSSGSYQLVAGERRFRASRMAGLSEVPVIIRELSDAQSMEIALIENLQREDLNPVEEALGYVSLMNEFNITQDDVARRVGKSRSAVANAVRLLNLPEPVLKMVEAGDISQGHARALLSFDDEEQCISVANQIVKSGLTVRDIERLGKSSSSKRVTTTTKTTTMRDSFYDEIELALMEEIGKKVKVNIINGEHGTITIDFYSQQELSDIANRLANEN